MTEQFTLSNEILSNFVEDLNSMLKNTIITMEKRDVVIGEINVKMTIILNKYAMVQNGKDGYNTITKPRIEHKIETKFVLKDTKIGSAIGDYEMYFDEETGEYGVRPINKQGSFYGDDTVYGTEADHPEREWEEAKVGEPALLEENNEVILSDDYIIIERGFPDVVFTEGEVTDVVEPGPNEDEEEDDE